MEMEQLRLLEVFADVEDPGWKNTLSKQETEGREVRENDFETDWMSRLHTPEICLPNSSSSSYFLLLLLPNKTHLLTRTQESTHSLTHTRTHADPRASISNNRRRRRRNQEPHKFQNSEVLVCNTTHLTRVCSSHRCMFCSPNHIYTFFSYRTFVLTLVLVLPIKHSSRIGVGQGEGGLGWWGFYDSSD